MGICPCPREHRRLASSVQVPTEGLAGSSPDHLTLKGGGGICGPCDAKNPLGNLRKMSIQQVLRLFAGSGGSLLFLRLHGPRGHDAILPRVGDELA